MSPMSNGIKSSIGSNPMCMLHSLGNISCLFYSFCSTAMLLIVCISEANSVFVITQNVMIWNLFNQLQVTERT